MEFFPGLFFNRKEKTPDLFLDLFKKITKSELETKDNDLYSKINSETIKISEYFENLVGKFHSLFECDLESFNES